MNVRLKDIKVVGSRIEYEFESSDCLDRLFDKNVPFFIEYMDETLNFESVPRSVLAIPFVTNLLALAWLYDFTIEVDELDEAFYTGIDHIKQGFHAVYPGVTFRGDVRVRELKNNSFQPSETVACLFSGGVDATYTMLKHRKEKPVLINVWGVDVAFDDIKGHETMESYCKDISSKFQCGYICVKSSLRSFLNEELLNREVYEMIEDFWWHGAQHSIGLVSVLAPFDFLKKIRTNYIASSFTEKEFSDGVKCVSYPVIDDALRIASTQTHHDGFDANRSKKIEYICETCIQEGITLNMKVCFNYIEGENCCCCEKCYRTMMDILVFDNCLERYGFRLRSGDSREIKRFLDNEEVRLFNWDPIQESYRKHPVNKEIKWFKNYKLNNFGSLKNKVARVIRRLVK